MRLKNEEPIRTVHLNEKLESIYTGIMGGKVYQYNYKHDSNFENRNTINDNLVNDEMACLCDVEHTVTCIRVCHLEKFNYSLLSLSTTEGNLHLYKL